MDRIYSLPYLYYCSQTCKLSRSRLQTLDPINPKPHTKGPGALRLCCRGFRSAQGSGRVGCRLSGLGFIEALIANGITLIFLALDMRPILKS